MNHVLCGLAANPALPSELVDRLMELADDDIATALACRSDLSRTQTAKLAAQFEHAAVQLVYEGKLSAADTDPATQPRAALALLEEGSGRPEWAHLLASDPVAEHREKLAGCPGLPPDVAERLSTDADVRVVAELALRTTPARAARLARHPHAEVRSAVAANEATPPAVLARLVTGDGLPPVRQCLVCDREATPFVHDPNCPRTDCRLRPGAACDGSHQSTLHELYERALRNPATPAEVLVGFAGHPSLQLRWALAARPGLPPQVFARLAGDPSCGVRADLAENPAIGEALMRQLAADADPEVRRAVAFNPRVPLDVLARLADVTKIGAVLLPRVAAASRAEVEELAVSPSPAVRMLVAARRDLPATIRDALAADPDAKVLASLAGHPGLSESRLRAMADRHGARVVAKVATNPDASAALLEHLAQQQPPVRRALREIARHRRATPSALLGCLADDKARRIAAGRPALPPAVLSDLLDDDFQVVEAAAANPSLPQAVMSQLVP
ncbi:hypothetical protein ACQEU8_01840 [Streptomyces sp. CA-250714]|uniref:hypothetical protein n=1 Tax=Streptomyces sp. CA-250714 TaxID=3240060 RepID=UPI003D8B6F4A